MCVLYYIVLYCVYCIAPLQVMAERQSSLESDLASSHRLCNDFRLRLMEATQQFSMEHAEWLQLQKDLQVAVVVANDFRTEAQHSFGTVVAENESLRDRVSALSKELAVVRQQLAAASKHLPLSSHCTHHPSINLQGTRVQALFG